MLVEIPLTVIYNESAKGDLNMEDLKSRHDKIVEERGAILEELKKLQENKVLKKYFELTEKNNELLYEQRKLIREIKINEYENCEHILVMTSYDYDNVEGRSEKFYGCIKCGLNQEVFRKVTGIFSRKFLTFEEQIMYDFIKGSYIHGIHLNVMCDLNLGKSIYLRIKQNCPDIDDNKVCKYLKIALDNVEKKEQNKEKRFAL